MARPLQLFGGERCAEDRASGQRTVYSTEIKMLRTLITLFVAAHLTAGIAADNRAKDHHVIIITIDGGAAFYLDDPKAPIPHLRKIAADGVAAKGMKVSNPAVTWPNHTTLVTGVTPAKHSVLYNGLMLPDKNGGLTRDPERDKTELVAVPTVYDFLHKKGFTTAGINWPCTRNAETIDDNFPDVPNMVNYSTPKLVQELVKEKILDDSSAAAFVNKSSSKRDDIWTDAACYVLRTRQPNFMLFHLLIADSTQHRFGPQTPEAYDALKSIDQHIGQLIDTLEKTGLRENTSVFIVADHGFERVDKQIVGTGILRKAGLLQTKEGKSRVQIISEGGTAMVYLHSKKTKNADRKKIIELFKTLEGVDEIIEPKDFAKYGYPSPKNNSQMADLVLSAKKTYAFSNLEMVQESIVPAREGGAGSHGYLSKNPKMNALFIASGRGIAKGKRIEVVENIDIAPTAAYLLGEDFPGAEGKILKQILATP